MSRVKRSVPARRYRKKILKMASGYYGRAKNCYTVAIEKVEKALQYAYVDRRNRKREFRGLWIIRINAALRKIGMNYSTFFGLINKAVTNDESLRMPNRKILADMAMNDEKAFLHLVEKVKVSAN